MASPGCHEVSLPFREPPDLWLRPLIRSPILENNEPMEITLKSPREISIQAMSRNIRVSYSETQNWPYFIFVPTRIVLM